MRQILIIFVIVVQLSVHDALAQDGVRWIQSTNRADGALIQEINRILDQTSPVRGSDQAIALKKLMSLYPVTILLDETALQEENISPAEPIVVPNVPGISIRNQLKWILDPLELTYVESPGYLAITTRKTSANVVRLYDVTRFVQTTKGQGAYNYMPLVNVIVNTITPTEWQDNGGTSTMREWRTAELAILVVAAPSETQTDIYDLLTSQQRLVQLAKSTKADGRFRPERFRPSAVRRSNLR